MLLTLNLHEYLVDEESIAVALMFSSQTLRKLRTKLIAPKTDRFVADRDTAFSQQVFNVAMAEVEAMVNPDRILDDGRWKSVSFV